VAKSKKTGTLKKVTSPKRGRKTPKRASPQFKLMDNVFLRPLQDGTVMVMSQAKIYHVNGLAADFIKRFEKNQDVDVISNELSLSHGFSSAQFKRDAMKFLLQLRKLKLAQVSPRR